MNWKRILTTGLLSFSFLGAFVHADTQDDLDRQLGPWLDLKGGGIAIGNPQGTVVTNPDGSVTGSYGRLANASVLPARGEGFESVSDPDSSAGTGHMISLIVNSAAAIHQAYPDVIVRIGDIARTQGGYFYPPHKSHQNGLDADILFMGARNWESVLDPDGQVTSRFDFVKNWQYWRSITAQQFSRNGKVESILSMILVAPEIKIALCQWANANAMLEDPLNREVMRRLRPTEGHDDHFHIRLQCSPYHAECTGSFGPPKETGC